MNKYQKLVQQQFLNNEEAVIKRLEKVYGQSQKDINQKISNLTFHIGKLQEEYDWMDDNDPEKAKVKSMIQSKIYQKQYQEALKSQVDGILQDMHKNAYKTVSDYLDKCYEDGFIGTMFDLQGQGIPLCFPLDQEAMVRAVQIDSKISKGLYSHLGEDVAKLKKHITSEVSRGISSGMSFSQVAQQIKFKMTGTYDNPGGSLAYASRIARTEGHRIQVQGGMDACYKAKEKGADVVKQWDSTLDSSTRESHQQVDGEIRELDERFSNGLMFPGDPSGGAAEVVNCRCALLQRARWALDKAELQTLQDRAEYFGLDKSKTFEDYKKKYLNIVDFSKNSDKMVLGNSNKFNIQFFAKIPKEKFTKYALDPIKQPDKAKTFKEALGYTLDNYQDLIDNIDSHFDQSLMKYKGTNEHGDLFEYVMELKGVNGKKANVCTAWIVGQGKTEAQLTSAYVTKKKVTMNDEN